MPNIIYVLIGLLIIGIVLCIKYGMKLYKLEKKEYDEYPEIVRLEIEKRSLIKK